MASDKICSLSVLVLTYTFLSWLTVIVEFFFQKSINKWLWFIVHLVINVYGKIFPNITHSFYEPGL